MPYDFGDVVLVPFPFTNQKAFKKRPAVIVSSRGYNAARPDVIIMAVTSQLSQRRAGRSFIVELATGKSAQTVSGQAGICHD
jgi:mRNA-degrading endonuclease toxin of MazEF toxin-antitoxin module